MWRSSTLLLLACASSSSPTSTLPPSTVDESQAEGATSIEGRFAPALLAAIQSSTATNIIDWEGLITSSFPAHLEVNRDELHTIFVARMERDGLLAQFRAGHERGDSFSVRTTRRDGQQVVRLRHVIAAGGINFHDFIVANCDGDPCARDTYDAASGVWLREELARLIVVFVQADGALRPGLQDAAGWVHAIRGAASAESWPAVLELWPLMPAELQATPGLIMLRLEAADHVSEAAYLEAMDDIVLRFPDRVPVHLIALDAYLLRGQWTKLRNSIAVLRAELPDPYWLAVEAIADLGDGNIEAFEERISRCIREDPDLAFPHELALAAWLGMGNPQRANIHLEALLNKFGVRPASLAASEDLEGVEQLDSFPN